MGYSANVHRTVQHELKIKQLEEKLAILEGKLHLKHRNTPSCPLPSDSAPLSQPDLETKAASKQRHGSLPPLKPIEPRQM